MRNKNQYIVRSLFVALFALTSSATLAQEKTAGVVQKKVGAIDQPVQNLGKLEPGVYQYDQQQSKTLQLPQGKHFGFTVAEVEAVFPELVKTSTRTYMYGKNTYRTAKVKTVDMEALIPVLVASIKQQQQEIDQLKQELQELKKPVAAIK